jgi:hypothetical protein
LYCLSNNWLEEPAARSLYPHGIIMEQIR